MKRIIIATLGLVLAIAAIAADPEPAPDFALKSTAGENVRLSELHGQVVLINFWASWCGPCRQELPHLDALYERYEPLGFTLLGINVEEDPTAAKRLLKDLPVSFPILLDSNNDVSKLYDVIAMPSTVIIDRDGRVRHVHHGYKPGYENLYQDQIRGLVRE
jgi:peroxiredoxin